MRRKRERERERERELEMGNEQVGQKSLKWDRKIRIFISNVSLKVERMRTFAPKRLPKEISKIK